MKNEKGINSFSGLNGWTVKNKIIFMVVAAGLVPTLILATIVNISLFY